MQIMWRVDRWWMVGLLFCWLDFSAAWACESSGPTPSPRVHSLGQSAEQARELKERRAELERDLGAERPGKRRRAVRDLAKIGDARAWKHVIEALEDTQPEVADEAQVRLGGLQDERTLQLLCGTGGLRSRDEWVRMRVAEALGRMQIEVPAGPLVRALDRRSPALTRALLWSLERLARGGHLGGELKSVRRSLRDWSRRRGAGGVRASALSAWVAVVLAFPAQVDKRGGSPVSDLREGIQEALQDREPCLRSAALEAWESLRRGAEGAALSLRLPESDPLISALSDGALLVRARASGLIGDSPSRARFLALVERLDVEPRSGLVWRTVAILQAGTGRLYRTDPRPWRDYLSGLQEDWSPAPPAAAPDAKAAAAGERGGRRALGEKTVALAGLPLLSDRVCVLVDFSGSLWYERPDGRTRKQLIDERMRALLRSLPEECRFNIIPYTAEPHPWRAALVAAKPPMLKQAIRDFESCRRRGQGNVFDAILLALEDPAVDTLLVLTDGAPTGGHRWNLDLMIDLLVEECRYRSVVIDSILVDAAKGLQERWKRLAHATGGRSIAIELD